MDKQVSPEDHQRFKDLAEQERTKEILEEARVEIINDAIADAGIDYPPEDDWIVPERSIINRKVRKKKKIKKALQKNSRRRNR